MNMYVPDHEKDWECLRMAHIQGGVCGSFYADIHHTTSLMLNGNIKLSHNGWTWMWWERMRMTENVWEWPTFRVGCGSFKAELHYTTCMTMAENYSDYLLMDEDVCAENAWEWLRVSENGPNPGRGCGTFNADIHYPTCIILNGNAWEWLRVSKNGSYSRRMGVGHSILIYTIGHAWYWTTCMMLSGNASDDLIMDEHDCDKSAWEWLRMCEKDSYPGKGMWVILGWVALYDMHENGWEFIRLSHNGWASMCWE